MPALDATTPRARRYMGMQLALRPLYTLPVGGHCALTLRLPCGRSLDLVLYDGGGHARSVFVWSMRGHAVHFVVAGDA